MGGTHEQRIGHACIAAMVIALVWSAVRPADRLTWFLEVLPAIAAAPLLFWFQRRGQVTWILSVAIAVHAWVLCIGGHWTYAQVPIGQWFIDLGWTQRNQFDKLGHLLQGFVPAMLVGELLKRRGIADVSSRIIQLLIVLVCGGISALYEIIEWQASALLGGSADDFLGTQGYVWDTQSDMLYALIGATVSVTLVLRWQYRAIDRSTTR